MSDPKFEEWPEYARRAVLDLQVGYTSDIAELHAKLEEEIEIQHAIADEANKIEADLRTKLAEVEAERDALLKFVAHCVEEGGDIYLDNDYCIYQDPVVIDVWWLRRDGPKTVGVVDCYNTAAEAVMAWLKARGEDTG